MRGTSGEKIYRMQLQISVAGIYLFMIENKLNLTSHARCMQRRASKEIHQIAIRSIFEQLLNSSRLSVLTRNVQRGMTLDCLQVDVGPQHAQSVDGKFVVGFGAVVQGCPTAFVLCVEQELDYLKHKTTCIINETVMSQTRNQSLAKYIQATISEIINYRYLTVKLAKGHC